MTELKRNDDFARQHRNQRDSRYPIAAPQVCIVSTPSDRSVHVVLVAYSARKRGRASRTGKRKRQSNQPSKRSQHSPQPVCEGVHSDVGDFDFEDMGYALGYESYGEHGEEYEDELEESDDQLENHEALMDIEGGNGGAHTEEPSALVQSVLAAMAEEERLVKQRPSVSMDTPEFEALNAIVNMASFFVGFRAFAGDTSCTLRLTRRGQSPSNAPPASGGAPAKHLKRRDMFLCQRRVEASSTPTWLPWSLL